MKVKSRMKIFFVYYFPVLFWMGVIFAFSAYRGYAPHSGELPLEQWLLRKGAHVVEYFVLTFLLFRVVWRNLEKRPALAFLATAIISLLYAISDEVHQSFVPLRQGRASDVAIDSIGIALGLLVWFWLWKLSTKKK